MYDKTDKRRLYQLMDMYLDNKISAWTFCDEFYYSYDLEIDEADLTQIEQDCFRALNAISSRFSPSEKDHIKYPGVYYTKEELRNKIIETKSKLGSPYGDLSNHDLPDSLNSW